MGVRGGGGPVKSYGFFSAARLLLILSILALFQRSWQPSPHGPYTRQRCGPGDFLLSARGEGGPDF